MQAPYILNLGLDYIRLLKRHGSDADLVGAVETDAVDLTPRLRSLVAETAGGTLSAELVLPDEQILYTTVSLGESGDLPDSARVRAALDGLTPYPVDEIAFDWADQGDQALVAAIALETLDEAAAFAAAHGITAQGFSARPDPAVFPHDPVFHDSRMEEAAAAEEEDPVEPQPESKPEPDAEAEVTASSGPEADTEPTTEPEPPAALKQEAEAEAEESDPVPREVTPPLPVPAFASRRAGPVEGEAAPAAAIEPARPDPVAASITTPDLPEGKPTANASNGAPTITTGDGFTADGVPDAGPAAASLRPREIDMPPVSVSSSPPETLKAAGRPTFDEGRSGRRRLAAAATVTLLLVGGAWTLVATFTPQDRVVTVPPEEIALTESPALSSPDPREPMEEQAGFGPTVEEMAETEGEALLSGADPAPAEDEAAPSLEIAGPVGAEPAPEGLRRAPEPPVSPRGSDQSGVELAAIDPPSTATDAFALGAPPEDDVLPLTETAPEPLETEPPESEIAATDPSVTVDDPAPSAETELTEGAVTPPGPPPIGAVTAPPGGVDLALDGDAVTAEDLAPTDLAAALDPEARPPSRPDDLVVEFQRARFGGRTLDELAALRPPARPASPQQDPSIDAAPTELAVLRAPVPQSRPDDIDELIAAARASQSAAQPEAAAASSTAGVAAASAPAAEPAATPARTSQPAIPTRAEVAREATIDNAIRLGRVNLIGVYGSNADRRALIRLPSGRYVKVKVGDRVDGGQVAAISDNQLRLVKGGQNITLTVPSG